MAVLCMVQLDLPTLRSWTPFTIMLYACVWVLSGLLQQSVCVQATEPPLAVRRKKLALQYCLKLSANTNNPAYNAVFNSKFKTQFDNKPSQTRSLGFRVEDDLQVLGFKKRMFYLQPFPQFHLGFSNALTVTSVCAVMIKQLLTQKCSNANSLSFVQSFHTTYTSTQMGPRMELEKLLLLLHPTLSKQFAYLTILIFLLPKFMHWTWR